MTPRFCKKWGVMTPRFVKNRGVMTPRSKIKKQFCDEVKGVKKFCDIYLRLYIRRLHMKINYEKTRLENFLFQIQILKNFQKEILHFKIFDLSVQKPTKSFLYSKNFAQKQKSLPSFTPYTALVGKSKEI